MEVGEEERGAGLGQIRKKRQDSPSGGRRESEWQVACLPGCELGGDEGTVCSPLTFLLYLRLPEGVDSVYVVHLYP